MRGMNQPGYIAHRYGNVKMEAPMQPLYTNKNVKK
jgi:hypothetical protein